MLFKVLRRYSLAFPREFHDSCAPVARNEFSNGSRADRLRLSTVSIGGDVRPMRCWRVRFRAPRAPVDSALKRGEGRCLAYFRSDGARDGVIRHSDASL
jgi:hypothetical protein